jgi:hypothetical protein
MMLYLRLGLRGPGLAHGLITEREGLILTLNLRNKKL